MTEKDKTLEELNSTIWGGLENYEDIERDAFEALEWTFPSVTFPLLINLGRVVTLICQAKWPQRNGHFVW